MSNHIESAHTSYHKLDSIICSRLPKIYYDDAADLAARSFSNISVLPIKIIAFLFKREFIKRAINENYIDISAVSNCRIIGIMRAKKTKGIWIINTNCVNKSYSKHKPMLWIEIMLTLAEEILKTTNSANVSFVTDRPAIAQIGVRYARRRGILINPIASSSTNLYSYQIEKNNA